MTTLWPDSLWPTKLTPSMSLTRAFMGFLQAKNERSLYHKMPSHSCRAKVLSRSPAGVGSRSKMESTRVLENWMPAGMTLESLRFEQRHGAAQVPGVGDQRDAAGRRPVCSSGAERRALSQVVQRGVFDPAGRNAVFVLQDVLHDAALGERAAAGLAAGDQDGQAAGAVQVGGVAQAFQADAVQGVAAVFGCVEAPPAAEDDDGVRRL